VDYVVFWNDVFSWLDPSKAEYAAMIVGQGNNKQSPELIREEDGQYQAFNAAPVGDFGGCKRPEIARLAEPIDKAANE